MKYLSPEWIQEANNNVTEIPPICDATIEVTVNQESGNAITYYVTLGPDQINFSSKKPNNVKLYYSTDWDTATSIAKGELSSQKAFLGETLTITGEVNLLDKHSKQIAEINDSLKELRASTIWDK